MQTIGPSPPLCLHEVVCSVCNLESSHEVVRDIRNCESFGFHRMDHTFVVVFEDVNKNWALGSGP